MSRKIIERLERIDRLVRFKATGTPKELASKFGVSESTLYEKMEWIFDVVLVVLFMLTMFYMFNLSAEVIHIPAIIVAIVLILYSICSKGNCLEKE